MSFSGSGFGRLRRGSTARRGARTTQRRVIGLERLEARLVLSTSTWTGMGSDANWSTAGNWDVPPVSGQGTNLIFPAGAAQLTNVDDLGAGATFGSLSFTGGDYSISAASGSTASFTSIDSAQSSDPNTFDVPLALSQATIITVDNATASLVLGGVISGSDAITTAGSGTVDLTADNTYTGNTTVDSGTLLVDGSQSGSAVTVESGATLGGMGTVGTVTAMGATVSPGNPAPGILTDAGALTMETDSSSNDSTFKVVLDGTTPGSGTGDYSQMQVAGPIDLSGVNLSATLGSDFVPSVGSTYTIIDNTSGTAITGTFNGQAEQSIVQISGMPFQITYVGGTGANSNSVVLTELDKSTTTVTFTPTSPVFGQSVALTATVTGPTGSTTPPTGTVQFFNGTTSLGPAMQLTNGTATMDVTTLPVGPNSITADYSGDSNFAPSTSAVQTVTVGQASSSTTIVPSTTTPVFGELVMLSATVQAVSPGAGTPSGTVQFFNGTTTLGTETLSSGTASVTTSTLSLGANSITVQYSGDTNFMGQTSPATTLTVSQASTLTSLTSSPSSPAFGQAVTLTASVVAVSPGTGTPTGTVEFMIGSTPLGTATLSAGVGSITTSSLPVGSDTISMVYSGNTDFKANTSTGSVTIGQSATSTSLTVSNPNPEATQSVTFTATVSPTSPGAGVPTGTVEFLSSGTSIGTATISGGKATFTTALPISVNLISAQYSGDSNFSSSTSSVVSVSVGTGNEQWINAVFEILLDRPITAAEIPYWNKQLAKGRSRYSIASEISKGKEAKLVAVQDSFNLYLGITGTQGEVVGVVKTAQRTSTSVQAALLGSKLFYQASGGTYTTYFQSLLTAVFGTTFPDRHIENLLSEGVSRIKVANEVLQSNLGRQSLLTYAYSEVLNRDPTQPEIVLYLKQMKNENVLLRSIVVTLLGSSEFYVKATSGTLMPSSL
jgi:trimeric autotransporter adhesin